MEDERECYAGRGGKVSGPQRGAAAPLDPRAPACTGKEIQYQELSTHQHERLLKAERISSPKWVSPKKLCHSVAERARSEGGSERAVASRASGVGRYARPIAGHHQADQRRKRSGNALMPRVETKEASLARSQ
jgi:hypothetical protein